LQSEEEGCWCKRYSGQLVWYWRGKPNVLLQKKIMLYEEHDAVFYVVFL